MTGSSTHKSNTPPAGGRLDETRVFVPVSVAILSVSDTRDTETDTSGAILASRVTAAGHKLAKRAIVPDNIEAIRDIIKSWTHTGTIDVIITTGGTGLTGRDVTPEAIKPMFDKEIEGFAIIWHQVSYQSVGLSTLQSRACAGLVNGVFVFCLPGSNGACRDGWDKVISWQLDNRHLPCNMIELMPRLRDV